MTLSSTKQAPLDVKEEWPTVTFQVPEARLGFQVTDLVKRCPPLDTNSSYCNLLQCHHFAQTSVAARNEIGGVVGFVSGYLIPGRDDTLFIWQVAVDKKARGMNLGVRMIREILQRDTCRNVRFLETSVTESNGPSTGMFKKFAKALDTDLHQEVLFCEKDHFVNLHPTEILFRIGPFTQETVNQIPDRG